MGTTPNAKLLLKKAEALKIGLDEVLQPPQKAWEQKNLKSDGFTTIGTLGNFSLVIGKAKSGKSFFINIAVSAAISKDIILGRHKGSLPKGQQDVLYFDTEQGKYHVQLALKRICRQTAIDEPKNLHVYHLRALKPSERIKIIEAVIYANETIGFVVIDGIRDLVTSINDEEQATEISNKLLKWTEERNIHIVVVLHQNKGNDQARGHLGTELINKAEIVLSVTKQPRNEDISIVKPEYCRNLEPEPFAFKIMDGLPTVVENHQEKKTSESSKQKLSCLGEGEKKKLLDDVFNVANDFMYGKLVKQIKLSYAKLYKETIGDNQAKEFITECRAKGRIHQERHKGKYTLMSSLEPP